MTSNHQLTNQSSKLKNKPVSTTTVDPPVNNCMFDCVDIQHGFVDIFLLKVFLQTNLLGVILICGEGN